jgi:hypothetical protein
VELWNTTTLSQARYFLTSSTLLENLAFFGGGERINNNLMNENDSKIQQQKKRETVVIENAQNTITSFDETKTNTNTNTTTLSTYQPASIHSSQINKQTNKHILSSHKHLLFDSHSHNIL